MSDYNGWKNRATWNVALWINNSEPLYREAVYFMHSYSGSKPYKDFISSIDYSDKITPDNEPYIDKRLSYKELNSMMREFRNDS